MSLNDYEAAASAHPAAQKLNEIQADLVSTARLSAVDEVGAVMAHQLYEPLTALLLYLHELKRRAGGDAGPTLQSANEMIDKALHETERVCEIMDRIDSSLEREITPDAALARGREAIDWVSRNSQTRPAVQGAQVQGIKSLTVREREVLNLITAGASNKEGGYRLGISMRTFEVHRAHIMAKLGARNAADLVRIALSEVR